VIDDATELVGPPVADYWTAHFQLRGNVQVAGRGLAARSRYCRKRHSLTCRSTKSHVWSSVYLCAATARQPIAGRKLGRRRAGAARSCNGGRFFAVARVRHRDRRRRLQRRDHR
jgi:hypothetical protein